MARTCSRCRSPPMFFQRLRPNGMQSGRFGGGADHQLTSSVIRTGALPPTSDSDSSPLTP
eukprot:1647122-Prymnesium_polylepis.2